MIPKTVAKFWKRKILRFFCARNEINRPSIRGATVDWNFCRFVKKSMIFANFLQEEFTIFAHGLESNSNFVCDPTNLYFSESPNPEVSKKYNLRLGEINRQRALWGGVVRPPRIGEIRQCKMNRIDLYRDAEALFSIGKVFWWDNMLLGLKLVVAHQSRIVEHFLWKVHLTLVGAQFSIRP